MVSVVHHYIYNGEYGTLSILGCDLNGKKNEN